MNATSTDQKELILSLIKDDLISLRLVNGLGRIGLDVKSYYLHLSETIFKLMDFKDNEYTDEVFQIYFELTRKAESIDISTSHFALNDLAIEIYRELIIQKKSRE